MIAQSCSLYPYNHLTVQFFRYNIIMAKARLDVLLFERGLVESRSLAQRLVMAGQVRVNGQVIIKPSTNVSPDAQIEINLGPPYVSRGGEKLAAALQAFGLPVEGKICADIGASTGGFTDCLLQNGAARVYAIDVGKGILHWKLRQDSRVMVMEETNARYVERLPETIHLVTIDASFISLKILLPVVKGWLIAQGSGGDVVALIKPQFEAGRAEVNRGDGVIRDPEIHQQVLMDILCFAQVQGYGVHGWIRSPLLGPKGNTEFLAWLSYPDDGTISTINISGGQ
ncbi:MAG: TlyA family RNA methyltransferase [Anaerolineales bacterium]|nr:TlyA family RNA methyltransferase [Anaerolineales bacterium]